MLIKNTCNFYEKKMCNLTLSILTCVLIYLLTRQNVLLKMVEKTVVFWIFCEIYRKISIMEFTVKEVVVFKVATFWNEVLCQIYFLRNIGII